MSEFGKSLVEAEELLNQLEPKYKNKIPQEFWHYVKENKDIRYHFNIDFNKSLEKQNIMPETVAILTYVNMEYLLNEHQKNFFKQVLISDEKQCELEKKKKYSIDVFKDTNKKIDINVPMIINEKWYVKLWNKIKNIFK